MSEPDGFSRFEHEWRTSVTAISAAAEILRDHAQLATLERDRFVQAILDESRKLTRTFENIAEFC
jgi:K+-sensing histidine kinase KdpD